MFFQNLLKSGWLHALFVAVVAFPAGNIIKRIVASDDINILAFMFVTMLTSSFTLLLFAGPGRLVRKTFRRPETWLYSFFNIIIGILALSTFKYISATEGSTLFRIEIFVTLLFSAIMLQQKINKYEILGSILIVISFFLIIDQSTIPPESKFLVVAFVILRSLCKGSMKIITEIHKTNRAAKVFKDSLRVTGFIMAISSLAFFSFLLTMSYFKQKYQLAILETFPVPMDFINKKMCIMALFIGFFISSFQKYCEFYAGKTIGAKYLVAVMSLQSIFVYAIEYTLSLFGIMTISTMPTELIIALSLTISGSIVIALSGFIKDFSFIKKGEKRDTLADMADNFVDSVKDFEMTQLNLNNLLSLYDWDFNRLAKDLQVDEFLLKMIVEHRMEEIKLRKSTSKRINYFASENVSLKDMLTKAYNRYSLEHRVSILFQSHIDFKIYLLDLNKFKPINDKHGHETGDAILIEIVSRLNLIEEFNNKVFRIGGDEFVLIQTYNLDKNLTKDIMSAIEQPFIYRGKSLEVSTSVGVANSISCPSLKEMLCIADEDMYKNKEGRN